MKIKLFPTNDQKVLLNKIFGSHRTIYNKLVHISSDDCYKLSKKELNSKYRPISQKHSLTNYLPKYHLDTPEEVMDSTFRDFTKAIHSSRELYKSLKEKEKDTTFPTLGFKSRKDNSTSIEIRSRSIKMSEDRSKLRFFPKYFGFSKDNGFDINKQIVPEINYSIRLQKTRKNEYYICIPRKKEFKETDSHRVCAIDPGVNNFITLYDPNGLIVSVNDKNDYIFKRCLWIDKLKSKLSKATGKRTRYRLHKKIYNGFQKIKAQTADMHHKISKWLSENYKEVLLPKFETSQMTSKQSRLTCKTSRKMLNLSHYKFKKMLEYKMERTGGRVIECTEEYTTKTCSNCGKINYKMTTEKVYNCKKCKLIMNRDANAARNILMKNENLLTWSLRF